MSSVLSPVGPQPPRVYWMRRVFVLGLPMILILVIAVSCTGGSKSPSPSSGGSPSTGPTTSTTSHGACAPADLSAALSTTPDVYQAGQSPVFVGTLTNVSNAPCQLTTSPSNESWTVESGPDHFWTTDGCPKSKAASTKTLNAGATRNVSITWDGHRLLPGCKPGESAAPGTYHLHATLDGVAAQQVTFHFTKNTQ